MSYSLSPPPPISPPPSNETEIVFGTLLVLTSLIICGGLGYLWYVKRDRQALPSPLSFFSSSKPTSSVSVAVPSRLSFRFASVDLERV